MSDARRIVLATHSAANHADKDAKRRAQNAAMKLRDTDKHGFASYALLNLLHRGAPPTEANILSESRIIANALEEFLAEQRQLRAASRDSLGAEAS